MLSDLHCTDYTKRTVFSLYCFSSVKKKKKKKGQANRILINPSLVYNHIKLVLGFGFLIAGSDAELKAHTLW